MVAKDPDRFITLCDSSGEVVARHNPRPEQDASEIASKRRAQNRSPNGSIGSEPVGTCDVRASLDAKKGRLGPGNPPDAGDVENAKA